MLTPTIISGPTPYAVKMDSSQVGGQNLQFVKGLKEWQTYQNSFLWKSHHKILQDPFNVLGVFCSRTQYSTRNWHDILYSYMYWGYKWHCKNKLNLIQTVNSTISSASSFSSSSKQSSSSSFSVFGQYQSSLGTAMPWKVIVSQRVKHYYFFF